MQQNMPELSKREEKEKSNIKKNWQLKKIDKDPIENIYKRLKNI